MVAANGYDERFAALLAERKLTPKDMADRLKISYQAVKKIVDGKSKMMAADHPCPATGQLRGACPGYVIDHITPLCAGGADAPGNMQWQSGANAKAKDRAERAQCRRKRA